MNYKIIHGDAVEEIKKLKDKSIKLFYGSPPYPNAKRDYGVWKSENYIEIITPFIQNAIPKLTDDGFIVINIKANRNKATTMQSSERSLVVERLLIHLKDTLNLYCVDVEIWVKSNPIPTGIRVACVDAYEYNLWFSKAPKWKINIDLIRRQYPQSTIDAYKKITYKPRKNGVNYISKIKQIKPNVLGALPLNILYGSISSKRGKHQAVQPNYLPQKYILACTNEGDLVLDPWAGSGTTGISTLNLNRNFIGIEIIKDFAILAEQNINDFVKNQRKEQK